MLHNTPVTHSRGRWEISALLIALAARPFSFAPLLRDNTARARPNSRIGGWEVVGVIWLSPPSASFGILTGATVSFGRLMECFISLGESV